MSIYQHNYPLFEDRVVIDCVFVSYKHGLGVFSNSRGYTVPNFSPDAIKRVFVMIQCRVFPIKITSWRGTISLTYNLVKVMEGFARSGLVSQIPDKLDLCQYVREGHSTLDALIYLLQEIHEATDRGDCGTRIFFADFSKCFDMIDHSFF